MDVEEKIRQEMNSFDNIKNNFKKIILQYDALSTYSDEKRYVHMGLLDFLLNENSLKY